MRRPTWSTYFVSSLVLLALVVSPLTSTVAWAGAASASVNAPPQAPNVTATVGGGGTYPTLKAAFDDINNGVLTGAVQLDIVGSTVETATASLNASGVGAASYTSVLIAPTVPATITGSIVGAVIKLAGADNVTIDGRIAGTGRNLTVANSSTAAATAAIWLTSLGAGAGATNNVIRNLELAGGATQNTGANATYGIILASNNTAISTSSNSDDNDNNSFIANRIIRARYGIVTRGTTTNLTQNTVVVDNIIGPTAFGADEIGKVGIFMQADTGALVARNVVQFVGGDFANTTGGADRVGIGIGQESWSGAPGTLTSNSYTVTKNIIHDVVEERTFSSVGLLLATTGGGSATNNLVANNFIYNVKANATAGDQTVGLGIAGGFSDTVAFNSIALTGDVDPNPSATATSIYGSGIRIANASGATHANLTLRNNSIYLDLSSSSTAAVRYYAISGNATGYSFGTGAEDNNNYYLNPSNPQLQTGGLGTTTGLTFTTQFATLANWQTAYTVPQDAASIQADPSYTSATGDLHITSLSANIGAAVTIASVTDDMDAEARPNGTNPDIGADEFYPLPGQLKLNAATYQSNEGTVVTVTVQRVSGSSGVVTVDYATSDNTATSGTCGVADYVAASGTLTFTEAVALQTFNVTLCSDALTDPSEMLTLTLSNPTGGASLMPPNVASLTITDVPPPFNGTYTVGAGGTYPSLTNVGGIFEAINLGGASGNITISVISDLSGELGTFALNEIAGGFTTLVKPSGAPYTITGSNAGALIKLNGTDGVTVDGSLSGGTDRSLTLQNTNTGGSTVIAVQSGTNGAQNNTLKNLNILGQDPTTTLVGISLGGNTPGTAGTDNDGNRVENNTVKRVIFGIYSAGQNAANPNTGTVITKNDLTATGADRIRRVGILVFNDNGVQITENSVGGINSNEGADAIGIGVGTQAVNDTNTTGGGISNAMVSRNKVSDVNNSNTFSAVGIAMAGVITGTNTIVNNMVVSVTANATAGDIVAGIYVVGATGSTTRLYYNSVSMTGDRGATATQFPSYSLAVTGVTPTVEAKNNNFYTTQTASGGGVNAKSYAIGMVASTFTNLDSNYNLFYASGANAGYFRTGSLSAGAGIDYATLALWQAAVSDDANSLESDPLYTSATDLHLTGTSPARNVGTSLAGVTTDYDGDTRDLVTPDIGADEFVPVYGLVIEPPTAAQNGDAGSVVTYTLTLTNTGNTSDTYTVTVSGNAWGTSAPASVGPLSAGASTTFNVAVTIPVTATDGLTDTVNVTATSFGDNAQTDSATLTTTALSTADLSITKTDDPDPVYVGQPLTYTLTVSNSGPSTPAQVLVTDTLPVGVTFVSASSGCAHASGVVTCALGFFGAAPMSGSNETPPNGSTGTGSLSFTYDYVTRLIVYTGAVSGLSTNVTAAHVHSASVGVAGAVIFGLTYITGTNSATFAGSATLTAAQEAALLSGKLYVNVHTTTFPGGELRAQLWPNFSTSSSINLSIVVIPTAAGLITNTATTAAALYDPNLSNNTDTESTTVLNTYGVDVTPATGAQSGNPGTVVTYTLTVTNTGTASDTFTVTVGGNAWGTSTSASVGPLGAGASTTLDVAVTIASNASGGATDSATVTLTSQANPSTSDSSSLTTTANTVRGVTVTPATDAQSGNPGAVVTYTLTVTNTGNASDTFTVTVGGNAWGTSAPASVGPLGAGASTTLNVAVTISATASGGATDSATVTVTSQGNPSANDSSALTTTANAVYGVTVAPATDAQTGDTGTLVTYTLTLTNTGNASDTFSVTVGSTTWTTTAVTPNVGPVAAGASMTFQITVAVPSGAADNDTDAATITVTSQGNNAQTDSATLTTTANVALYYLYLPLIRK